MFSSIERAGAIILRRLISTSAAVLFSTAAIGLVKPAQADTDFILANVRDAESIQNVASRAFIAKLEEFLGSSITVVHHPGGGLGDCVGLFELTMQGSIQMTQTWNASEFNARLDLATLGYTAGTWGECVET